MAKFATKIKSSLITRKQTKHRIMTQFELSETKSNKNNKDTPILHFQYFQYFPFSASSEAQWQRVHNTYVDRSNVQTQCLWYTNVTLTNHPTVLLAPPTKPIIPCWYLEQGPKIYNWNVWYRTGKKFFFFFGARSFGTTCAVGKGPNQTTLLLLVWLLRQKRAQIWTWERDADFWCIARGSDKENSSSSLLVTDL